MIEPTLGTAVAFCIAAIGVTTLVNALRYAWVDEALYGAIMVFVAYWITTLGPVL